MAAIPSGRTYIKFLDHPPVAESAPKRQTNIPSGVGTVHILTHPYGTMYTVVMIKVSFQHGEDQHQPPRHDVQPAMVPNWLASRDRWSSLVDNPQNVRSVRASAPYR